MSVGEYIEKLLASPRFAGRIRTHRLLPGREARFADSRLPWPAAVRRLLEARGLARLYTHQALATDYVRSGRDTFHRSIVCRHFA